MEGIAQWSSALFLFIWPELSCSFYSFMHFTIIIHSNSFIRANYYLQTNILCNEITLYHLWVVHSSPIPPHPSGEGQHGPVWPSSFLQHTGPSPSTTWMITLDVWDSFLYASWWPLQLLSLVCKYSLVPTRYALYLEYWYWYCISNVRIWHIFLCSSKWA